MLLHGTGVGDREVGGRDLPHPVAGGVAVDGGDAPTVLDRCHAAQRVVGTGRLSQRRWRLFRTGPAGPAPATSGGSEEPAWHPSGLVDQLHRACHSGEGVGAACAPVNIEAGVGELDDVFILVADGKGEGLFRRPVGGGQGVPR